MVKLAYYRLLGEYISQNADVFTNHRSVDV